MRRGAGGGGPWSEVDGLSDQDIKGEMGLLAKDEAILYPLTRV